MTNTFSHIESMKRILIIGAGTFGGIAVERLGERVPSAEITLVDQDPTALKQFENRSIQTVCRDGIAFLSEQMETGSPPDAIVPAIPRHVAWEWMSRALRPGAMVEPIPVPDEVFKKLPNPFRGPNGEAYMSNADFICPDNCPEPETLCTVTGKPRPRILHAYAAAITYKDFRSIVIVSRQMAPGVGGYSPQALRDALAQVEASSTPVLLSTACKCHGVMHAFRMKMTIFQHSEI